VGASRGTVNHKPLYEGGDAKRRRGGNAGLGGRGGNSGEMAGRVRGDRLEKRRWMAGGWKKRKTLVPREPGGDGGKGGKKTIPGVHVGARILEGKKVGG